MDRIEVLHEMIHSLDKGQKRQVLLQAGLQKSAKGGDKREKNYLRLFEILDSMPAYTSKVLERKLKRHGLTDSLHSSTKYLIKFILKIRNFYYDGTYAEVTNLLRQMDILRQMKLYPEINRLMVRAKEIASEQENFTIHLEILNLEQQVLEEKGNLKQYFSALDQIIADRNRVEEKLGNYNRYQEIHSHIRFFIKTKHKVRTEIEMERIDQILSNPLMQSEAHALSKRAKFSFHSIKLDYLKIKGDMPLMAVQCQKAIDILEENPVILKINLENYLNKIVLLASCQLILGQIEAAELTFEKLKSVVPEHQHLKDKSFENFAPVLLGHYMDRGETFKGLKLIDEMEEYLKKRAKTVPQGKLLLWYYGFGYFFLLSGHTSTARKWIDSFLQLSRSDNRTDLQSFARILNLMIYIDSGELEILDDAVRSTRRFLKDRGRFFNFENHFLKFAKKLTSLYSEEQKKRAYRKLRTQMEEILQDPYESQAKNYIDILTWLDSKLESRSMSDLLKEKHREPALI